MESILKKKAEALFFPVVGREIHVGHIDVPFIGSPFGRYCEDGFVVETYLSSTFSLPEFSYVVWIKFQRDMRSFDLQKVKSIAVERIKRNMRVKRFEIRYILVSLVFQGNYLISNIHQEIRGDG